MDGQQETATRRHDTCLIKKKLRSTEILQRRFAFAGTFIYCYPGPKTIGTNFHETAYLMQTRKKAKMQILGGSLRLFWKVDSQGNLKNKPRAFPQPKSPRDFIGHFNVLPSAYQPGYSSSRRLNQGIWRVARFLRDTPGSTSNSVLSLWDTS